MNNNKEVNGKEETKVLINRLRESITIIDHTLEALEDRSIDGHTWNDIALMRSFIDNVFCSYLHPDVEDKPISP